MPTIQIRISDEQKRFWLAAAGDVPLSRWIRRHCDVAANPFERHELPPPALISTPDEAKRALKPRGRAVCRHGLADCRVCKTGKWAE